MADQHLRKRVKSDDDSEGSFSESDIEIGDTNEAQNNPEVVDEKVIADKKETGINVAEGSEYESAEELEDKDTKENEKDEKEAEIESCKDPEVEESLSEIVDEEGGKEGTAEVEDVEGDFLSGDANDEDDVSEEEEGEYVEEERQQGDGEECSPDGVGTEKELDFDEDRRNPQYIPKKGVFYEHDDRNNEDVKEKEEEPTRDRKKKLWLDEGKWGHDRFREEEQYPKSRHELVETYGYDIRNEDGPPRARRRRRYGRGPTKYDRSWEDVTAYGREKFRAAPGGLTRGVRGVGRSRGGPRFRGRGRSHYDSENPDQNGDISIQHEVPGDGDKEIEAADVSETTPIINNVEFPALPTKTSEPKEEVLPEQTYFNKSTSNDTKSVRTLMFENSNYSNRNSVEKDIPVPPRRGKTPPFSNIHERGTRRGVPRGTRGHGRGEFNKRGRGTRHISPRFLENKVNHLSSDLEHLSLDASETCNEDISETLQGESNGVHPDNSNELLSMALKGAGDSSGRPKRYSSLRQRSLPETSTYQPPQQQHPSYYEAGYQSGMYAPTDTCVLTPSTQSQTVSSPPILNPSAYQTFTPPPYTDNYAINLPVTTPPPSLFPQVSVPGPQPMLPPPPCITPAPNLMGFAPAPPPASYHQFAYQRYAAPPPPPPLPPTVQPSPSDLYQAGITYYYPQSQIPPTIRPTVQKRPKAAIPILPPPEREGKRIEKKESPPSSSNRSYSESSNDPGNEVSLRTDSSQLQQPTIGVES